MLALAMRGDLGGMSFSFTVPEGGDLWAGNQRELIDVNLLEVSVISSWPAYQATSVEARCRGGACGCADLRSIVAEIHAGSALKAARRFLETL